VGTLLWPAADGPASYWAAAQSSVGLSALLRILGWAVASAGADALLRLVVEPAGGLLCGLAAGAAPALAFLRLMFLPVQPLELRWLLPAEALAVGGAWAFRARPFESAERYDARVQEARAYSHIKAEEDIWADAKGAGVALALDEDDDGLAA
jgi:hypothetical protein